MDTSRRSRSRVMSQINVVPYIDVMLVLLVIFMVTAPMINTGQVDLPQVGKSSAAPAQPIEVRVLGGNQVALRDGSTASERRVNLDELGAIVKQGQSQTPGETRPVVIAADQRVEYGKVMEVMDQLQMAGVQRIGLLTKAKGGN
ncbi:MAG: protein TolR [Betaproteobacteria bacterium]|jgi:biopolymer transport protein TolR|nr:protein TolR [Rhodocyclaceae bacterium]MCA3135840.1 protein TolR [Rhodocyclaceae bacterium]MCA3140887.1 protein TolR [Rhodocyclaceae bacterium]MCA3147346.1 protein TolR [Rhodocyclaceae bacterium]MCE2897160.1 protein TolR [Betaproteobacteria bacterium]